MKQHLSGRKHAEMLKGGGEIKGICFEYRDKGYCSRRNYCSYNHLDSFGSSLCMPVSVSYQKNSLLKSRSGKCPLGYCFQWWNNGSCNNGSSCMYKHYMPEESDAESENDSNLDDYYSSTSKYYEDETNVVTPVKPKRKSNDESSGTLTSEFLICKKGQKKNEEDPTEKEKLYPLFCKPVKKEKKQRFPEKYKDLYYRKRDVSLYCENGLVIWEFAYDVRIIEAIKENIKGRAWNKNIGIKGCWTNPLESLPDAIALYEHMGRTAPIELKERAEEIKKTHGGVSPSDTIQVIVKIFINELKSAKEHALGDLSSIGSLSVKFLYDATVVEAVKELAPTQRTYDPELKIWQVDLLALSHLLESLDQKGFEADEKLEELSSIVEDINSLMFESDTSEDDDQDDQADKLEKKLKALIELVSKDWGNTNNAMKLLSSDCGSAKRRRISSSLYRSFDSDILDGISNFARRTAFHNLNKQCIPDDCDCGRQEITVRGVHTCRYYGTFECYCGNTWTSAYCWKGEKQACRSCEDESFPTETRPLERGLGVEGGAPHDSSRCGRCRSLGYPCNLSY